MHNNQQEMSVETPVSQNINSINEKLAYDALSSNFHMPNFENYRELENYHALNNNFTKEINLSPLDVNFQNTQIFTVPINVLPPPPHKIVHYQNNIILKKLDSKYGGKNKDIRSDVRAVSPKGYESDESGRSSLYSTKCVQQAIKTNDKSNSKCDFLHFKFCKSRVRLLIIIIKVLFSINKNNM